MPRLHEEALLRTGVKLLPSATVALDIDGDVEIVSFSFDTQLWVARAERAASDDDDNAMVQLAIPFEFETLFNRIMDVHDKWFGPQEDSDAVDCDMSLLRLRWDCHSLD